MSGANAPAKPPTLKIGAAQGTQDTAISLPISVTPGASGDKVVVEIAGLPKGASLSQGSLGPFGVWTLTLAQLAGLKLIPPAHFSGELDFAVVALETNAVGFTTAAFGLLDVRVFAPAVAPTLTVHDAKGQSGDPIALSIQETVAHGGCGPIHQVFVYGVPQGAKLSAGVALGDGVYRLDADDLRGLTLTPPVGYSGSIKLTIVADELGTGDGSQAASSATLTVTVAASGDGLLSPDVDPDSYADASGKTLTIAAAQGLLANDVISAVDSLKVVAFQKVTAKGGAVTVNPDGSFTYAPKAGFVGVDSFTYTAVDAFGRSATATVSIVVSAKGGANSQHVQAPVAQDDLYSDPSGKTLAISVDQGVLANDRVAAADSLKVTAADTKSAHGGTVQVNADGSFSYTPAAGFSGEDTFRYTATDAFGTKVTAVVRVEVTAERDAPNLKVVNDSGAANSAIALNISASPGAFTGPDQLSVLISGVPSGATLSAGSNVGNGVYLLNAAQLAGLTLTPPANFVGAFTLEAVATNTPLNGWPEGSAAASFTVTVNAVALAPLLTVTSTSANEGAAAIALSIGASQAASYLAPADLTVTIKGLQGATLSAGTKNPDGSYTLTPAQLVGLKLTPPPTFVGDLKLTVVATDTEPSSHTSASSAPKTLDVILNPVASAPTLSVAPASANEGATAIPLSITAAQAFSYLSPNDLVVKITGLQGATLSAGTKNPDGSYTLTAAQLVGLKLTPPSTFVGDLKLTVVATDTEPSSHTSASSAPKTLDVILNPVASAPTLTVVSATANEGATAIPLSITAAQAFSYLSPNDLVVKITGLQGATLSAGTKNPDGSYTLTPAQLVGLKLTPPPTFVGDLKLTVVATDTEPSSHTSASSGPKTLDVILNPVASAPTLTVAPANANEGATAIPISITAAQAFSYLSPNDLVVKITGLQGATLSAGTKNPDGSYTLTPAQLVGLTITPPPTFVGDLALTVVATDSEPSSHTSASSAPKTLDVILNPVASAPTLTIAPATGAENAAAIPLSISAAQAFSYLAPADLSIAISGLQGATLSAGTHNADGSYTLTGAQLAGLALTPPANFAGDLLLTVVATDAEPSSHTTASSAAQTLDVKVTGSSGGLPQTPVFDLANTDQTGVHQTTSQFVTLIGKTDPGDTVTLSAGAKSTIANTAGVFEFDNVQLASGDNNITATASNAKGQSPFTLDVVRSAPTASGANLVLQWNQTTLAAIALDADAPTVASRTLALESLAVYDALQAINGAPGYLVSVTAPADASATAAIAEAADVVLDHLYPAQSATFDAQMASELATVASGQAKTDGVALGQQVANQLLALRANDGSDDVVVDNGSTTPGQWQPTAPGFGNAVTPQWANVTPFALTSPDQFLPAGPPSPTSAAYAAAVNETESLGAGDSTTRTADETQIALYWNDPTGTYTPSGQWNGIADQFAADDDDSLAESAQLLAILNVAEADAGIASFNAKYTDNAWRPITAIQNANEIGNPGITQDPTWTPLLTTPAFPEYVAGHPTYSAAAAAVLDQFFGANTSFQYTQPSIGSDAGTTRSYTSFDAAAVEAGLSRIYGGIHFSFSVDDGLTLGSEIGAYVLQVMNGNTDTTPPTIQLLQASGQATRVDPTVSGIVADNLSGVAGLEASLDGATAAPVTFDSTGDFAIALTLPTDGSADGEHVLAFTAIDAAGNVSAPVYYDFDLETSGPTITLAANSVQDNGVLAAGAKIAGNIEGEHGDLLVALSYAFDGGPAHSLAFDAQGAFSDTLDLSALGTGAHTLVITGKDTAGNVTNDTLHVTLPSLPALTIASLSPSVDATDVGVTYRPKVTFSRAVNASTLNASSFYATDSTGAVIPATIVPITDTTGAVTGAWMLFSGAMPGGATVTLHVDGALIQAAADGALLSGAGAPGTAFTETFSTVSLSPVAGTTISGIVVDPGPDDSPMSPDDFKAAADGSMDFANDTWKLPIAGVKVYILGDEADAVYTDATGHFQLSNVPVGDVKIVFDGTTATNDPSGVYFPTMTMDLTNVRPGIDNKVMGSMGTLAEQQADALDPAVYLPRVQSDVLTPLSATQPTVIHAIPSSDFGVGQVALTAQQLSELTLTIQPGSLVDANGDPVANPQVGISPVPPQIVQDMLPAGLLQHSFDVTIQAPGGAVFTQPVTLTAPNVLGLAPGEKTYILSFDHTTGRLVIDGTGTVSADGSVITSDPGSGITAPGWHGFTPSGTDGNINNKPNPSPNTNPNPPPVPYDPNMTYVGTGGSSSSNLTTSQYLDLVQQARGSQNQANTYINDGLGLSSIPEAAETASTGLKVTSTVAGAALNTYNLGANAVSLYGSVDTLNTLYYNTPNASAQDYVVAEGDFIKNGAATLAAGGSFIPGVAPYAALAGTAITAVDYTSAATFTSYFQWYYDTPLLPPVPKLTQAQRQALQKDPPLVITLSEDAWQGDAEVIVLVDGQQVLGPTTITASHASGATQALTVDVGDTGPHSVTIEFLNPATGAQYNQQRNLYIQGISFNGQSFADQDTLYGANASDDKLTSATFTVGPGVTDDQVAYESTGQELASEAAYQLPIFEQIQKDAPLLQSFDAAIVAGTATTTTDFGQFFGATQTLQDFLNQLLKLQNHPTLSASADDAVSAYVNFTTELQNESYAQVASLLPAVKPSDTEYALLQGSDGSVQRFTYNPNEGLAYIFAPETFYSLSVFDPVTGYIGTRVFESAGSGETTTVPQIALVPDTGTPGADGLSGAAAQIIGVDNTKASNLVPGVTDLAALREGLVSAASLGQFTGVVGTAALDGAAQTVALTGSTNIGADQLAYVGTSQGLAIVDVSTSSNPIVLSQLALPGAASSGGGGGVVVAAAVIGGGGGASGSGVTAVGVDATLNIAAAATGAAGLQLIDVSDPTAPTLVTTVAVDATQVEVLDGIAYANDGGALDAIDMSTGEILQTLALGGAAITGMARDGAFLYTMDASDTLRVIDVSTGIMQLDGSLTLAAGGGQIYAANGVVYVPTNNETSGGYSTVDVSHPAAPALIQTPQDTGIVSADIALNGSGLGLAVGKDGGGPSGVAAVDLVNTSNPANTGAFVTRYTLPAQPQDVSAEPFGVAIANGVGYVAAGTTGLDVVRFQPIDTTATAPTVTLSDLPASVGPAGGGLQLYEGSLVTLGATISGNTQIRNLELLENGQVVQNLISFPFDFTTTLPTIAGAGSNSVTLQVEAIDMAGNIGLSAPVQVTLVKDTTPPVLLSQNIQPGSYIGTQDRNFLFLFSKPIDPNTVNADDFVLTGPAGVVAPQAFQLKLQGREVEVSYPTLATGAYTLSIQADDVLDTAGVALGTGALNTSFQVFPFTDEWASPTTGGNWSNGANWTTGAAPGPTDLVDVNLATGGAIVIDTSPTVKVLDILNKPSLTMNGQTLTITQSALINAPMAISNGGLVSTGSVAVGDLSLQSASLTGAGAIAIDGDTTVLDRNVTFAAGQIDNAGIVDITNNNYLNANGVISNSDQIQLNSAGNDTRLQVTGGDLTLQGGGQVVMTDGANNSILTPDGVTRTLFNVDNTLSGAGNLGAGTSLALDNETDGVVDATGGNALVFNLAQGVVNAGLLEATNPGALAQTGGLVIQSTTIANSGTIQAVGAGDAVYLRSTAIVGGTLQDSDGGLIEAIDRTSTLDNVTNLGTVVVTNNNYMSIRDTIANKGQILVSSAGNDTRIILDAGNVTLNGGGALTLSDNVNNSVAGTAGQTLVNTDNTISGAGTIGVGSLSLDNQATVDATGANALIIDTGALADINTGTLEDTGAGGLTLRTSTFQNAGGTIQASVAGAHVDLVSATIVGGVLQTASGGVIQAINRTPALDGVTNHGVLAVTNNNYLVLRNAIVNTGEIDVNSAGNDTRIVLDNDDVTLTGGGLVKLTDIPNNSISSSTGHTLTNVDNTISGSGWIGVDGGLTVVNEATIDATGAANQLILDTGTHAFTNSSVLEDTGPAGLLLRNSTFQNAGGVITALAAGDHVDLQSATIVGGTLQTANGGVIQAINRTSALDGVTNAGTLAVLNNQYLALRNTITNKGQIDLNSAGNDTRVLLDAGAVNLQGGGQIVLSDNGENNIADIDATARTLNNVDNTISGAGNLGGVTQLSINNEAKGVIDATGAHALIVNMPQGLTNAGLMESTDPNALASLGGLLIQSTTIANSGTILASGTGAHVDLQSGVIVGGVVQTANGGVVQAIDRGSVLDNVTSTATIAVTNNNYLTLRDTITNKGQIDLNSVGNDTRITLDATNVTLTGAGSVILTDNGANSIVASAAKTLTNVNNAISGAGWIGNGGLLTFVNQSTVSATGTNALIIDTAGNVVTNTGTFSDVGTGGLLLRTSTFNNGGGTIQALAAGSHVDLQSATIIGGTLNSAAGGVVQAVDRGSAVDGVSNLGVLQVTNNNFLVLRNTIVNSGTIKLNSVGNDTRLMLDTSDTVLTGGGAVVLTDTTANSFQSGAVHTLTNANNTISGSGNIGAGSNLAFVNASGAIVDATGGSAFIINTAQSVQNAGLMEATNPNALAATGGLSIQSTTITNSVGGVGGTIEANGAATHVDLTSATIVGGVLTTANGGVIQAVNRTSALDSVTNSGAVIVANNQYLALRGVIANSGTITLNSAGNDTRLRLDEADVSLTGGGKITLTDTSANLIDNSSGTLLTLHNVNNTISGAGGIGGGSQLGLDNQAAGVINASGANALVISASGAVNNAGLLEATGAGGLVVNDSVSNGGAIAAKGGNVTINGDVSGAGAIQISSASRVELKGAVGAAAVAFQNNSGDTGVLVVDHSATNGGQAGIGGATIANFYQNAGASDLLGMQDLNFASGVSWTFAENAAGAAGVLTVADSQGHSAAIELLGGYLAAGQTASSASGSTLFALASDSVTHTNGTLVSTSFQHP